MVKKSAFTLIEILVVLGIIMAILAFVAPKVRNTLFRSEITLNKMKMGAIKDAMLQYKQDMGHFPNKKEGGLEALVTRPNIPGNEKWVGPYLEEDAITDKWGMEIEYNIPPVKYKQYRYYEIISAGGESVDAQEIPDGV